LFVCSVDNVLLSLCPHSLLVSIGCHTGHFVLDAKGLQKIVLIANELNSHDDQVCLKSIFPREPLKLVDGANDMNLECW
jgi:hypothetical protein